MASIKKRGSNTYQITVSNGYDRNNKKITEHKTIKLDSSMTERQQEKEIKRLADEFEKEVKSGKYIDQSITFESFTSRWMVEYAECQLERKTISSYRDQLESKILPAIGHIRLAQLQPLNLMRFYDNLTEDGVRLDGKPGGYSTRTIKYCHQIISSILQTAIHWQILQDNPASRVKPPKGAPKKKKINYLDEKQAIAFLDYISTAPLKYRALINIAIYGGHRLEEILPLTWHDVNFKNHTIDINKALSYVDREQFVKDTTKNDESTRLNTLPHHVFTILKELKLQTPQTNVFSMHYSTPGHWLKKMLIRYNESHEEKLPIVSFHGLRHTHATLLISMGLDIKTISGRLGHKDTSTTLNIYGHYIRSRDEAASDALESLLHKKE